MEGRPVLVTGASGFTGASLCAALTAAGRHVVAYVRASSRVDRLRRLGVECRVVDITDPRDLASAFEPFSTVFHVAAAFRTEHADLGEFRRVNVEATGHLLRLAAERGVERFVHCSTVGVQGAIDSPPAAEDYRFAPGDYYQETKLEGELLARDFMKRGLAVTVVRPVGIYGPGDRRFLKLFRPIARGRFVMVGDGEVLYHLTYIDDLVDGFLLAAHSPAAVGEVFTIAGARYTTLSELVDLIADSLGVRRPRLRVPAAPVLAASHLCERVFRLIGANPPLYPRRVEFFIKDRAFDISKARGLLGYEPKVDLEEGLGRTADWYRDEGLL